MKKIIFLIKRNFLVNFLGLIHTIGATFAVRFPPVPTTSAIITNGNKILVIKLSYENGYALPGGVLQRGEDFEQGVKREVFEETGLKIVSLKYFKSFYFTQKYFGVNVTYLAKVTGNLRSSKEGTPMWLDIGVLKDKLVFMDNKWAIRDLLKLQNR